MQMQQFARSQQMAQQNMMHQQMRRDPSDMTMNGQRPRTPSAGDHAPSPSKRQRIEGIPFNGQQMMPNGRGPPQGLPGQQMMADPQAQHANQLLISNGINPGNLSESQFTSFQQQNPAVQAKSIQVYAQNLAKNQRDSMSKAGGMSDQGSPMMAPGMDLGVGGPDFYAGANSVAAMQMRNGGVPPHGAANGAGGNHALQDYQMQLMLLEQQNKKRLLMARQEQDTITRPDGQPGMPGPAGFAPGMSPQGSRGGPSPGPGEQGRRGTPKMGQPGLPGSPLPDGSIRGSPAAMNFNSMNPDIYGQMNGGPMRPPPSSHPGFNGPFNPQQQMEAMQRAAQAGARMPNGNWQQGPQGQAPMMQQPQPQQPAQMGTPQQRNDMPPPQGLPAGAIANGRPGSPAAPPTPQPANKANPKGKKDTKDRKVSFPCEIACSSTSNVWPDIFDRNLPKRTRRPVSHRQQLPKLRILLPRRHHQRQSHPHTPTRSLQRATHKARRALCKVQHQHHRLSLLRRSQIQPLRRNSISTELM